MSDAKTGDNKRKHLEMIQGVINRMASNQFLFKGWSITLIAAIATFSAKGNSPALMAIPIIATLLFWCVDAYYLMLERAFRNLYDEVTDRSEEEITFKMSIGDKGIKQADWWVSFWRPILAGFYGTVLIALLVLTAVVNSLRIEVIMHHGA